MTLLLHPVLRLAVHETGELECLSPWFVAVTFDPAFLARADGHRLEIRGDEVTLRCTNGGAVYQLGPVDALGHRPGRLVRSWR